MFYHAKIYLFMLILPCMHGCAREIAPANRASIILNSEKMTLMDYIKDANNLVSKNNLTFSTPRLKNVGIYGGIVYDDYIVFFLPSSSLDSEFAIATPNNSARNLTTLKLETRIKTKKHLSDDFYFIVFD